MSQSIIDLILVSDHNRIISSGVVDCYLSDHCMVYLCRKIKKKNYNGHNTVLLRSTKIYNPDAFCEVLKRVDWSPVLNCKNVDIAWACFKELFCKVLDMVAPIKKVRVKQKSEPWITDDIHQLLRSRNVSFKMFKKKMDSISFEQYKQRGNEVRDVIKEAKINYFKDKIKQNSQNPKKLWGVLKNLGYSDTVKGKSGNINLKIKGNLVSNPKDVSESFNRYFISLASNLRKQIPPSINKYNEKTTQFYYGQKGVASDAFKLCPVIDSDIYKLMSELNINKAPGIDNIPVKYFKDSAKVTAPLIAYIINLSIQQGEVPLDFKSARVVPLHKKSCKSDMTDYRPVSILCVASKIMERVIYNQIENYIVKNCILYALQSGFRPLHSTETCIIHLTDSIRKAVDKGDFCGMVMLDLQKAFDTIDHEILIYKLKAIGFDKNSLKWVQSYLKDRKQQVDIKGTLSNPLFINCGVPQGSLLGPLFFLLYINDLKVACPEELFLYADDVAAIVVAHRDKEMVEKTMSLQLEEISKWFLDNKLFLHLGKTEAILFASKMKLNKQGSFVVKSNDMILESKSVVQYLGCFIDNKLTGDYMASKMIAKICGKVKFLARQANLLDTYSLRLLANALVQPHFDYASSFWYSSCSQRWKNKLQKSQNKLVRTILKMHPRTHINNDCFKELGLLNVEKRVIFLKLGMSRKILNNMVPKYLVNYYNMVRTQHLYNTRGRDFNIYPCGFKSLVGKNSFLYTSAMAWNKLSTSIKNITELKHFKRVLKKWLMEDTV